MVLASDTNLDPVHILVAGLAVASGIISFFVQRSIGGIDKRQDQNEKQIEQVRCDLTDEADRSWTRHDGEHNRIHQENEEEHRRIRGDIASNSEDIARLLERTKDQ